MQLRVATFNLLNLARAGYQCYPGVPACDSAQYAARIDWLAQTFDRINADVFLLQEIFHSSALNDVLARMQRGSSYQPYVMDAGADNIKPRVALLSRWPLTSPVQSLEIFATSCEVQLPGGSVHGRFSRPVMKARVAVPGAAEVTIINAHLKSRRPWFVPHEVQTDPIVLARAQLRALLMRAAEAVALREIVVAALCETDAPLIVGGDFNDAAKAASTMIVAGDSNLPFALRHAAEICIDPAQAHSPHTICDAGYAERIDHLLLSDHFVFGSPKQRAHVQSVETFDQHLPAGGHPAQRESSAQSVAPLPPIYPDHAAVCATIVFDHM